MTRRRPQASPGITDQFDMNNEVENMMETVKVIGEVSKAIGEEIDAQNRFIADMNQRYEQGLNALSNLLDGMKRLAVSSGVSPMTMTMLFVLAVILFLWLYWKFNA